MKKAIITLTGLLILLLSNSCNRNPSSAAGKNQSGLTGLYEFQINKTTLADLKKLPYKYEEFTLYDDTAHGGNKLGGGVGDWDLFCPGLRKFNIELIEKGNISLNDIRLVFYQDTLISFSCTSSGSMADILKAKYPNYTQSDDNATYWWLNDGIEADAGGGSMDLFHIFDRRKIKNIDPCAEEAKTEYLKKNAGGI